MMTSALSRSLASILARRITPSSPSSSVSASLKEKTSEETPGVRLAPAQSGRMDDLGTRNIFTTEQDMFRESGERETCDRLYISPQSAAT